MPAIVWLEQVGAGDLALVGGKAANLGELVRAGFEVPRGFVVTTSAYRRRKPDGSVPKAVADSILIAWRELVGGSGARVAVRSSATAEDLAEASFAGQQESFLGVEGFAAVLAAVADCWASLYSERAVAYRREHDVDETGIGIAVVVQLMVEAKAAGVMFTANPVSGDRRETVINAAPGLGEAVVAGTVNPDTYVVDRDRHLVVRGRRGGPAAATAVPDARATDEPGRHGGARPPVLSDELAVELAGIGDRVEAHFGVPQDIEWALDDSGFRLLQARPVTALPEPVVELPDEWPCVPGNMYFRASIVEQMPSPLTPLFADLVAVAVPDSMRRLFVELSEEFGNRGTSEIAELDMDLPTINGYAYYRYTHAALRTYTRVSLPALRHLYSRGGDVFISRWRDGALPAYRAAVAEWAARDASRTASAVLLAGVEALLLASCTYYTHVQTVIPLTGTAELAWSSLHKTLIGGRRVSAEQYLLGFDSAPVLAEKALWDLGQWVRAHGELAEALADPELDVRGAVPSGVPEEAWTQWLTRFGEYLGRYGHTVYDLDFVHPTPADDPRPMLQALRLIIAGRGTDPYARQSAMVHARERVTAELLDSLDPVRRAAADRTLRWAQKIVPVREDALAAMGLAWPLMRRLLAELGRRLVSVGILADPEEVYWLTREELGRAIAGDRLPGLAERIARRRALRRGQERLRPPQYLPRSRAMSLWDRFLPARVDGDGGNVLKGNAGSGGVVTGPARVIDGPSDFAGFEPGEVLVAEITTPAYTPLFAMAGGIVTDVGGVLSHGSIVAREYGIPAVLGTASATSRIATGDIVTVDGDRGEVRLAGAGAVPERRTWVPWAIGGGAAAAGIAAWLIGRRRRT